MTVAAQVKQSLATLKSVQASLQIYTGQSQSQEAGLVFDQAGKTTGEIIHDLEERLKVLEFEEPQYKGF